MDTKLPLCVRLTYFHLVFHAKSIKFRRDKNSKHCIFKKMANIALENCFLK
jgi:hypothetical protein